MKDSEIYRRAAEIAHRGEFSCCAIDIAIYGAAGMFTPQRLKFSHLFSEYGGELSPVSVFYAGGKTWRVLALCLMAAICEEEGR